MVYGRFQMSRVRCLVSCASRRIEAWLRQRYIIAVFLLSAYWHRKRKH